MAETKLVSVSTIKIGSNVVLDGTPCKVTGLSVSRPGKHGHAKINMTAVGLVDGKKRVIIMPGHDKIEAPIIDKKTAQILSITGDKANVMDMETYETFDLDIPAELKKDVKDGVQILYWEILDIRVMKQVKS